MMFNSFFNYLFGTHREEILRGVEDIGLGLTSIATEDDWVFIDKTNKITQYSLEESWYITPPSCFPFKEPILLETSSLENLLIEFPNVSLGSDVLKQRELHINIKSTLKPKDVEHNQANPDVAPNNKENECIAIKPQEGSSQHAPSCSLIWLKLGKPNKARDLSQDERLEQSSHDSNNNNC